MTSKSNDIEAAEDRARTAESAAATSPRRMPIAEAQTGKGIRERRALVTPDDLAQLQSLADRLSQFQDEGPDDAPYQSRALQMERAILEARLALHVCSSLPA
jgi:hypothetical protein